MKIINSINNPIIKNLVKLHDAKNRKENKTCLVEGARACQTFISSKLNLIQIYLTQEQFNNINIKNIINIIDQNKITLVSSKIMRKISQAHTPSGIIGHFNTPEKLDPNNIGPGLVLAQIQDPGNIGTLIRTAVALNIDSIIIIKNSADIWSYKAIQASAGTVAHAKIFELNWQELILYKKNLNLVALVINSEKLINNINPENSLIIVGNEANGIPEKWQEQCDQKITLKMPGSGAESLNAAVAGSIALYCMYQVFS